MTESLSCHIPVMYSEVLEQLAAENGGEFLDCTLGGAGHTRGILEANPVNQVTGCDRDPEAISRAHDLLGEYANRLNLVHSSFADLELHISQKRFNGILADLGLSSDQLADQRGFSYLDEGPLDMRMDSTQELTAADIVNNYDFRNLSKIFQIGGMGKEVKPLVNEILRQRPFNSTREFAEMARRVCLPFERDKNRDPATLTFQSLRIAVNQEYQQIEALLTLIPEIVESGASFVCISFHSGEDRLIANKMRSWQNGEQLPALHPQARELAKNTSKGVLVTKKALLPTNAEIDRNPRARSARMRVFKFN